MINLGLINITIIIFSEGSFTEIKSGLDLPLNIQDEKYTNIISEDYQNGADFDAYHINCSLEPKMPSDMKINMTMMVNEFAPYANSNGYCLYIDNHQEPLKCSGSRTFQDKFGPFENKSGWKFWMSQNESTTSVENVRFWITIACKLIVVNQSSFLSYTMYGK